MYRLGCISTCCAASGYWTWYQFHFAQWKREETWYNYNEHNSSSVLCTWTHTHTQKDAYFHYCPILIASSNLEHSGIKISRYDATTLVCLRSVTLTIPTILIQDWTVPGIVAISDGNSPSGYYLCTLNFAASKEQVSVFVTGIALNILTN